MSAAEQARREEVFAALFDRFWAPVRHHIEWLVHDDAEVTEIVSEVFLQAWSRLDPEKPMNRVWLLRAADRILRSRSSSRSSARSSRAETRPAVLDAVHAGLVPPASGEPADGDRARVLRALRALTPRQRRIIMLTYWDGLDEGEIAELTRSPRSRVRSASRLAQSRLREALDREGARERRG